MKNPRPRVRAYLLVQVLLMLPLAGLLLVLLGTLAVDMLYVQRVAAEHANLAALSDHLARQLRADARACTRYTLAGDNLTLQVRTREGARSIVYTLNPQFIRRQGPDGADTAWEHHRLAFSWHIEDGPLADLLWLDLRELPPARKTAVLPRSYTTSFLLPEDAQ
jgi:hypothetical protein